MLIDKIFFKTCFKYIIYFLFLPFWFIQKLIKRNSKIWVFGSWYGNNYTDNSRALFEYILNYRKDIRCIWLTNNKNIYDYLRIKNVQVYYIYSIRSIFYSLRAKLFIVCCSKKDVNTYFSNGGLFINLWHGSPMKKICLDENIRSKARRFMNRELDSKFFYYTVPRQLFPFVCEYKIDYLCSCGDIFNEHLSSAFNIGREKILTLGYPRNDIIYQKGKSNYVEDLRKKITFEKTILYLPTFRSGCTISDLFLENNFEAAEYQTFLEKINGIFLYKDHNINQFDNLNFNCNRIIRIPSNPLFEVNEVYSSTDVLITDYSGACFDFMLTEKPIIYSGFDLKHYTTYDRELYFDYNDISARKYAKNWVEIMQKLIILSNNSFKFKLQNNLNIKYNKYRNNMASNRIYSKLCNILDESK